MFLSPVGKPMNLDALVRDSIRPVLVKAGLTWHGWHAFRRGLASNLNRLGIDDSIIQAILRHSDVALTQRCYIKTVRSDAMAAMDVLERSLKYAPNMHLEDANDSHLM
jgi:integrase